MKKMMMAVFVIFLLVLTSCTVDEVLDPDRPGYPAATLTPTDVPQESPTLEESAEQVINALAEKDLETVAEFVNPEMGVRLSPYAFVRESHQVFYPETLPGLVESDAVFVWGRYDGSGEPIELTFNEYYEEFVYSSDFANAEQTAVNERLGQGNTINNIPEFYPESSYVEYYIPGTEENNQMDWESLRLVFVQRNEIWFLVGIVHDQWTI